MDVAQHTHGSFCWMELTTNDASAATKFYGELYGWNAVDVSIGPQAIYSMFQLNERNVAAVYQDGRPGMPVCWNCYVSVKDADETAHAAKELGGTVISEPVDVMELGRMAVLKDPSGAAFSIWQAGVHPGAGAINEPGAPCWAELMTTDTEGCERFYTALGWGTNSSMSNYTMFTVADEPVAGMMSISPDMGNVPSHWLPYIQVADCDASASLVKELGGKVVVPPTDVPGVGRFAILLDPQGAVSAMLAVAGK